MSPTEPSPGREDPVSLIQGFSLSIKDLNSSLLPLPGLGGGWVLASCFQGGCPGSGYHLHETHGK